MHLRRCLLAVCSAISLLGAEFENNPSTGANDDPVLAMKKFKVPPGLQVELFAAEPQFANPVAFTIDEHGQVYVAETYRHSAVGPAYRLFEGVLDIRSHMDWLDEELALRTVDDRVKMLRRKVGPQISKFQRLSEQVRFLKDTNGDGRADVSTIYADGFNSIEDGIGAGLLARDGKVYYTCIPNLWVFEDKNNDGQADERKSLSQGYGVHIAYLGHDLHGLIFGPDGRLYFSIGDRGINVRTKEGKRLEYPDEGVVLRCEPDGSNLEVFARGLRNPQELAFDNYGNLFTGDNNSDGGDRARWVYLIEGGDSGWRIGYQHLNAGPRRGPWNAEKLWYPHWKGQAAYIVPPIANLGYGPSGLAYYPGLGLGEKYQNRFFLCDFRGGASSGIHSFTVKPQGAGFELDLYEQFVWETLPTDVEFGPDGSVYFSDWIEGWQKTGKGRIYRTFNPESKNDPQIQELKRLMVSVREQTPDQLEKLLAHPDMRIRQRAQFALVENCSDARERFLRTLKSSSNKLARLHGVWGLSQLARIKKERAALRDLAPFATDPDEHVRAQTIQALGDARFEPASATIVNALADQSAYVQSIAAIAAGKLRLEGATPAVLKLITQASENDPVLRHAAISALAGGSSAGDLADFRSHADQGVRKAAVVALRRQQNEKVADFLADREQDIVLEAARAINDVPINGGLKKLAALLADPARFKHEPRTNVTVTSTAAATEALSSIVPETSTTTQYEQLFGRVINANFRLGENAHARALGAFAATPAVPDSMRAEAISALADWATPSGRDRVMGLWRPLKARSPKPAAEAIATLLPNLLQQGSPALQAAALDGVRKLNLRATEPLLATAAKNAATPSATRAEILKILFAWKSENLQSVLESARASADPLLITEARAIRAQLNPAQSAAELAQALSTGNTREKQNVIALLGLVKAPEFTSILEQHLDKLLARQSPPEIELDLLDAAARQATPALLAKIQRYELSRPKTFLGPLQECVHGGDAELGKTIFFERAEVFCSRCHTIKGEGGQAGPDLTGIGARQTREYLLEAVVFPNLKIAEGWENLLVTTKDGSSYAGKLKKETDSELVIDSPEDGEVTVKKSDLKSRERALSAMPEEFRHVLTKHDLRNLVEFLASQRN